MHLYIQEILWNKSEYICLKTGWPAVSLIMSSQCSVRTWWICQKKARLLLLTCSHEFIDFGWTSLRLLHAVSFLQEVIDLRKVDARVWRHAICGNFPQQHPKSCKEEGFRRSNIRQMEMRYRVETIQTQCDCMHMCCSPQTSDLMEKVLYARLSGAVHLIGNLAPAWAVYVSPVINRLKPKSATFTTWFSPTRQFLAARSLRGEEEGEGEGGKQGREREKISFPHEWANARSVNKHTTSDSKYPLTCVWSSSSPGIPWQRRSVWPCRAAPQHSPPLYHTLSSSPVGCHVACTQLRCKTEAPGYTHLWRIQMPTIKVLTCASKPAMVYNQEARK